MIYFLKHTINMSPIVLVTSFISKQYFNLLKMSLTTITKYLFYNVFLTFPIYREKEIFLMRKSEIIVLKLIL